jgi:transposase
MVREEFRNWQAWAVRSKLEPIQENARMLKAQIDNVLMYYDHRITNALTEAVNSTIQMIKKKAYGSRNKEHFKMMIYFIEGSATTSYQHDSLKNQKVIENESRY